MAPRQGPERSPRKSARQTEVSAFPAAVEAEEVVRQAAKRRGGERGLRVADPMEQGGEQPSELGELLGQRPRGDANVGAARHVGTDGEEREHALLGGARAPGALEPQLSGD